MNATPSRKRRSAHTPAAQGGKWIHPSTRWAIYHRDAFTCVYCLNTGRLSLDHVRSVEGSGRDNSSSNLVTCCVSCNSAKQALTMRQWLAVLRIGGIDTTEVRRRITRQTRRKLDRAKGREFVQRSKAGVALRLGPPRHVDCDCMSCRPWTS